VTKGESVQVITETPQMVQVRIVATRERLWISRRVAQGGATRDVVAWLIESVVQRAA
jgi:hypothetical protein